MLQMLNDTGIDELSKQLQHRKDMIDALVTGIRSSNDLIDQIQSMINTTDTRISDLTKQIGDAESVSTVVNDLKAKNDKLTSLISTYSSTLKPIVPSVINK